MSLVRAIAVLGVAAVCGVKAHAQEVAPLHVVSLIAQADRAAYLCSRGTAAECKSAAALESEIRGLGWCASLPISAKDRGWHPCPKADPVATPEEADKMLYRKQRNDFLSEVWGAYLAVGCKVVASEVSVLPYLGLMQRALLPEISSLDPDLRRLYQQNREAGLKAATLGRCNFYTDDPMRMARFRAAVNAAAAIETAH